MTSLYQACMRRHVVETVTARHKKVKRWYYLDIEAALDRQRNREDAVVGVPEDRIQRTDFGRTVLLDLSSPEREFQEAMFPVNQVFDWDAWQDGFGDYWIAQNQIGKRELFRRFKDNVLQNFKNYQVPVIALDRVRRARLSVWFSRRSILAASRLMHSNWSLRCMQPKASSCARTGWGMMPIPVVSISCPFLGVRPSRIMASSKRLRPPSFCRRFR